MTQNVSLEFLARQFERVLTRLDAIEVQIPVFTGMAIRHDGALTRRATEFRGLARSVSQADYRSDIDSLAANVPCDLLGSEKSVGEEIAFRR